MCVYACVCVCMCVYVCVCVILRDDLRGERLRKRLLLKDRER
jgi:hypothetical protein